MSELTYDPASAGIEKIRKSWGWFLVLGIALAVLGVCCVASALTATFPTVFVFGLLLLISAVFQLVHAFRTGTWSGALLNLLSAVFRGFTRFATRDRWNVRKGKDRMREDTESGGNDAGRVRRNPTEEALSRSELTCRALFETAVDAVILLDATGLVDCNMSAAHMYGLAREDLIGRSPTDLSPEFQPDGQPSAEAFAMRAAAALAGEAQHFEWVSRRAGGALFEVDVTLGRAGEAGSTLLLAIFRDVTERRCAERRLRESEGRFQAAYMNGFDALFLATLEEGVIVDVNPLWEELFGYSREEVIDKTALEIGLFPDVADQARLVAELNARGRVPGFVAKLRKKCGDSFVGSLSMVTLVVDGKQHTAGAIRDITAAQRADRILRVLLQLSQHQTQNVRGLLDDALSEAIILTESEIGHIHIYDESRREFTLNTWSKETLPECAIANPRTCCRPEETGAWGEAVRQRKAVVFNDFQADHPSKEGAPEGHVPISRFMTLPVFKGNSIVAVVCVANKANAYNGTDVLQLTLLMDGVWRLVEVRQSEQATREANERHLTITKCIPDTLWSIDLSGRFTYVSPGVERLQGWTAAECMALNYRDVVKPEDAARIGLVLNEELERAALPQSDRHAVRTFECELLRKDGSTFWAEVSTSFVWSDDGTPIGCTGVTRDITERKQAETEREKLCAQLAHAQKMESIARLAGGVAHDFNNLLTVINGYANLALAGLRADDPLRNQMKEISQAGERAARLARQLLAFSRKQLLQPRSLSLNSLVRDMQSFLQRLLGEDVEVLLSFAAEDLTVHADPQQLEQVIMNLAVNSRDAMPSGGQLLIETSLVERDESYAKLHPEARPGRYALLAVSDNGMGMDEATQQRIFEPFFTTKEVGKGTGLGLSMVQGIVAQSGGHINVYSELGRGTTFKIYLPALAEATIDVEQPAVVSELRGKETILVVEDQEEVRRLVVAALKAYGYRVIEAADARAALLICEQESARIHMVLTDVVMPRMSGQELVTRLAKVRPEIKALYMSGYTDDFILQHGLLDAGTDFIKKPFAPEELAGKIRAVLGPPAPAARILVVDDEAEVRGFLRAVLEQGGYNVIEAADGKQALQGVRAGQVDLVITDLVMPEQEGLETIRTLRREVPGVGIIAISGGFAGQFLKVAQLLGADAALSKPVSNELLLAKVAEVLDRRR